MKRVVSAAAWFSLGWLACFGQGLYGSKLHGLFRDWLTWQAASREQRQRIREERERLGDRGDWLPDNDDLRSN